MAERRRASLLPPPRAGAAAGEDGGPARDLPGRLAAEEVKREARALGFHLVGIARAERFAEAEARTLAWLARGYQAEMRWLDAERARRACDPAALLPGARSLIVVGVSYHRGRPADRPPADSRPRGRIARYALGADYHDVLRARLALLVDRIAARLGRRPAARLFVDSAPLSEREAARRAGLGFFGKNTTLLTRVGSHVLLGAVLTDLELEPDRPAVGDCGRCRRCLDACPTGALVAPAVLDANRCISYLTIEHRGPIPPDLRPALGDWVFGCDICQDVCPWNWGAGPVPWPELVGSPADERPALDDLLRLDDAAFRARFRGSAVTRAKRRGLVRNAAVAAGNARDPVLVPALVGALADPEPLVRGHAAWALGQIGGPAARAALAAARTTEADPSVRAEIAAALAAAGRPS